ncbi:MAG: precorrin-6y C5,15-methyltransferase (decarboxylating) subunit CbiE [Dongiaceae bacterium]
MTPWLSNVGIGEAGLASLEPRGRKLIDEAALLVGGERHLAMVPPGAAKRITWEVPLSRTVEEILRWRGRKVAVLATGDPMWFGIGVTLARHVPMAELTILPQISAFSLAAARLGWPLAEIDCLTLHGRPLDILNAAVAPGARLLLLSHDGTTPALVAHRLTELGYGASRIEVLEHMDGAREGRIAGIAAQWEAAHTADLNTIAVTCVADGKTAPLPRLPGLPDEAFAHDGQLTKREYRAAALARLAPLPGECLWDVGAGAGSIAIEWLRSHRSLSAHAIEQGADRVALIEANAKALGVPQLAIHHGRAPAALEGLPQPNAVFIGGGLTVAGLVESCWNALPKGGRLVAHAVTTESEARLLALQSELGGELTRLAVSRAEPVGSFLGWKPLMPVTQLVAVKP